MYREYDDRNYIERCSSRYERRKHIQRRARHTDCRYPSYSDCNSKPNDSGDKQFGSNYHQHHNKNQRGINGDDQYGCGHHLQHRGDVEHHGSEYH
jgi:hypothetical protein